MCEFNLDSVDCEEIVLNDVFRCVCGEMSMLNDDELMIVLFVVSVGV